MVYQYTEKTAADLIRTVKSNLDLPGWDFLIYGCTTSKTSQSTWDKFISLLQADAEEVLSKPEDADLLKGLSWTVIQDATLEGKGWKAARDHFDVWVQTKVKTELTEENTRFLGDISTQEDQVWVEKQVFQAQLDAEPQLSYFVYVDDSSVQSVVETDAQNNRGRRGAYHITIVQTGLMYRGEDEDLEAEDETLSGEDDDFIEEYWREFRQRFKAWDLVKAYAVLVRGDWPDIWEMDEEGINRIVSL